MRSSVIKSRRATKEDARTIAQSIFFKTADREGEAMLLEASGTQEAEEGLSDRLILMDEDSNQIETMAVDEYGGSPRAKTTVGDGDDDEDEETALIRLCGGPDQYEQLMIDIQNELDDETEEENAWSADPQEEEDWAYAQEPSNGSPYEEVDVNLFGDEEEEEDDENTLICPFCRTGTMRLSPDSVVCTCGKAIPLRDPGPPPILLSVYDLKRVLAEAYERYVVATARCSSHHIPIVQRPQFLTIFHFSSFYWPLLNTDTCRAPWATTRTTFTLWKRAATSFVYARNAGPGTPFSASSDDFSLSYTERGR
tara:strand:- start:78 stop:1007 length:930 start_codon:yes stop_codon:yes gene_type:complete